MIHRFLASSTLALVCVHFASVHSYGQAPAVLTSEDFRHYVEYFNQMEDENSIQAIPNDQSWEWMRANVPLFESPQANFEEMYDYRWWSLRKPITETPTGYAFTELLVPRGSADKYNRISCALGHHIMESRWLHDPQYVQQGVHVWYRGNAGTPMAKLRAFSSWTAAALLEKHKTNAGGEKIASSPHLERVTGELPQ